MAQQGADRAFSQPRAAWSVRIDGGQDLTDRFEPLLVSLRLTEQRAESCDELEIVLVDRTGEIELPPEGSRLQVSLGWERGTGVAIGLVDKGTFLVDEVAWDGPPDRITLRARSADMAKSFRTRRTRTWNGKTIGEIVGQVAADNGLNAACHPDFAATVVTSVEQANKSDMQLLRDLGRRYDAIATVKDGNLIFAPIGADTTVGGSPIPSIELTRSAGDRYSYRRASREKAQDGAEATWHDQGAAKQKTASHGGQNRKRLKRIYASQADADAAAKSETNRLARAAASFEVTLAYGDAAIAAGMKATLSGFKSEIDAKTWRIARVEHEMDSNGFRSRLEMETAG
ncbi:contractile injection system protein, VgrG/Pvc8 family [Croceicoccus sp. BE223]|uniref:contractile injection system protein, VgrG/Pvc8 family n=1 Tax=Croceicoccus sp. BE223 TaxID=2817716 RepID=UPI0028643383|nr:contractile injection system protein, VgrG/Pvc8 family [Croceicoccus sp. BE223]MDR7101448.1 phage protein D [Croceicoccus sp. BE223]